VSDGGVPAAVVDPNLVNAWGLAASATSPWWVANNGTDTSTLYNGNTGLALPLVVTVPGSPTGATFNFSTGFKITTGTASLAARFIFATENGQILGWNPGVSATSAVVTVDNPAGTAVYKGLAFAQTSAGAFIYATNFRTAKVEVYDSTWTLMPGGFEDSSIPNGYAPFGIHNINGTIYVTYALQDDQKHDDVAGRGHGFVDAFDTAGKFLRRAISRGRLNSPWGVALAPAGFGEFSGDLLVGNFGDGRINAFDPTDLRDNGEYERRGLMQSDDDKPIVIDGLWALAFGNGAAAGPTTTLFFTSGPLGEQHGLFGSITAEPDR
jgi:uncharacterized protein (TIGR03118 family)